MKRPTLILLVLAGIGLARLSDRFLEWARHRAMASEALKAGK